MHTRLRYLMFAALIAGVAPAATAAEPTSAAPAAAPGGSQQRARELLLGMARFLGAEQNFSVRLDAEYDVLQANGQKVEFGESREVSVQRPDKFVAVLRESSGRGDTMLFDGRNITISDAEAGVYARAPQPGDIDASIVYFVRGLGMRLPVAPVFMSRFAQELEARVREVDLVETTDRLGMTAHHLAGRTDAVDFQVWVRDGEQPLPLRMVLSYRNEPAHPEFRVDFADWNLEPRFGRKTFAFDPPEGSQQIVFAVQMVPAGDTGAGTQQQQGGAKP